MSNSPSRHRSRRSLSRDVITCTARMAVPCTIAVVIPPAIISAQDAGASRLASVGTKVESRVASARQKDLDPDARGRNLAAGNVLEFPFGSGEPVVTCTLLRVCVIELQPGEVVVNEPIAGDAVRWIIEGAKAGPDGRNALIVVKPKFCRITTNLIVPTDRRIYDVTLDSPPCRTGQGDQYNPQQPYARHMRFTYPDDSGTTRAPHVALDVGEVHETGMPNSAAPRTDSAQRSYRVVRKRRGLFGLFRREPLDFPWQPAAVYDDGAHMYFELPPEARHQAAPVLYALEADGSRGLLNYTVGQTPAGDGLYVTDRVVSRVLLLLRSGDREHRLVVERHSRPAPRLTESPNGLR